MHDTTAAVGHPLETWGRTIEYEYITRTGTDDTSERADAVAATAKKPFAVLDLASAEVFCSEVAARKVIAICATGTNKSMNAQQPYRYSTFIDYWANVIGTAELIGKGLKDKPAQWAGDAAMKTTDAQVRERLPDRADRDRRRPLEELAGEVQGAEVRGGARLRRRHRRPARQQRALAGAGPGDDRQAQGRAA